MHGHKIKNQDALHFITITVVGWVDVFTRMQYKDIIIESLKFCVQNKGLKLYAYVIMTNHLHLIVSADAGISDIIRDFKKFTSKEILKLLIEDSKESRREWMLRLFKYFAKYNKDNKTYQFWQKDNHPIELANLEWIDQKLMYIHNNPVRAGIVESPEHYIYSSAINYIGRNGIIDVEILDLGFKKLRN